MRLSAKIIRSVSGVNHWEYATEAFIQEGQVNEIYFQLVDLDKTHYLEKSRSLPDFPLRYIPQGTVVEVEAEFPALIDDEVITIVATQPFLDDKSIWKVTFAEDQVPSSGNFIIRLTEDGATKTFLTRNTLRVELLEVGGC